MIPKSKTPPFAGGELLPTERVITGGDLNSATSAPEPKPDTGHAVIDSGKSTSTKAQAERILEILRKGPATTDDLRAAGCYQVSARVFGLRAKGFRIDTVLFNGRGADGLHHKKMACYSLLAEPDEGGRT